MFFSQDDAMCVEQRMISTEFNAASFFNVSLPRKSNDTHFSYKAGYVVGSKSIILCKRRDAESYTVCLYPTEVANNIFS